VPDLQPDRQGTLPLDGHDIHWEYFGRGDREAFCLLNGLAMHTKAWYGFVPRLQPDFDVLLYDYPGQGQSSARDVPYSIPAVASYLTSTLDHLSIERVHAMGVSYGGFIALAPAVAAEQFGTIGLGAILGALYTSAGIGGLVGPPLMGRLIDAYDYTPTLVIAMALALVSAVTLLPLDRRPAR